MTGKGDWEYADIETMVCGIFVTVLDMRKHNQRAVVVDNVINQLFYILFGIAGGDALSKTYIFK